MKTVRVAIAGVGNVGTKIAQAIEARANDYASRLGIKLIITGACSSTGGRVSEQGITAKDIELRSGFEPSLVGSSFMERLDADILIEAGPSDYATGQPGLSYINSALDQSMDVICVSKGALVVAGDEIYRRAGSDRQVRVSCAAASAMPSVDFLTYDLAGAGITRVEALLTGTTTFVLDSMTRQGVEYPAAVAEAQRRGIAEPQPEFDLEGWDTAAKLLVIARAVFGVSLSIDEIPRQSLSDISADQFTEWNRARVVPRLVGTLELSEGGSVRAKVEIRAYAPTHAFSLTEGSMKALAVSTDHMGEYTLIGGASSPIATAAAALKDLEHIVAG